MKILLCHNFYQQPGGEDQVFDDEAWLLESRGHEVVRYTLHNDAVEAMGRATLVAKTLWNRESYADLLALMRRERPALLHCHNTFPLISPSAYAAARAAKVPVVQSLHNFRLFCPAGLFLRQGQACEDCLGKLVPWPAVLHECYRGARGPSAVVAGMLGLHRLLRTWTRQVDRYIALSEFSRRKFVLGGLPAERLACKPNFMRADPGQGAGRGGYAVFVGRLSEEKGVRTLLAAWEQDPQAVPLKLLGDGPLAAQVQAAAARDARIEYLGRRASAEVLPILGDASCLVLPSLCYENCPKTVLEAYAKGTPVVASHLGAMAEMVHDGRTGLLFTPGKSHELAAKVRHLTGNAAASAAMRSAARREYETRYTAEINYSLLMQVYQRVLRGPCAEIQRRRPVETPCAAARSADPVGDMHAAMKGLS